MLQTSSRLDNPRVLIDEILTEAVVQEDCCRTQGQDEHRSQQTTIRPMCVGARKPEVYVEAVMSKQWSEFTYEDL